MARITITLLAVASMSCLGAITPPSATAAGASGTVALAADCINGHYTAASITESFGGLDIASPFPSYRVDIQVQTLDNNGVINGQDQSSTWYPEADGSYAYSGTFTLPSNSPEPTLEHGESFSWQLEAISGAQATQAAVGGGTVGGKPCRANTHKPEKPNLSRTADPLLVSNKGTVQVVVTDDPHLSGQVSVTASHLLDKVALATGKTGEATKTLTLAKKDFAHLKKVRGEKVTISARVHNKNGSASTKRAVTLKAPKKKH